MARNARIVLTLVAVVLGLASVSQAATFTKLGPSFTLDQLLGSPTVIQAGDKTFSNFNYMPGNGAPSAASIVIEPVQLNGELGLHIVGPWTAFGAQLLDSALSFQVAASGTFSIDGATLWAPGAAAGGPGVVSIIENIFDQVPGNPITAPLMVYTGSATGTQLLATAGIAPSKTLVFAFKNIILSGGGSGVAVMSEMFQTFHQKDDLPEPATLGLLVAGGLFMVRRRR